MHIHLSVSLPWPYLPHSYILAVAHYTAATRWKQKILSVQLEIRPWDFARLRLVQIFSSDYLYFAVIKWLYTNIYGFQKSWTRHTIIVVCTSLLLNLIWCFFFHLYLISLLLLSRILYLSATLKVYYVENYIKPTRKLICLIVFIFEQLSLLHFNCFAHSIE